MTDLLSALDAAGPADRRSLEARAAETELDLAWSLYCEMAARCDLPVPEEKSPARVKLILKRLADHGGLAKWRYALESIERSRELRGENRRGRKVHIDYVLSAARYVQLLERAAFDQDWGKPRAETGGKPAGRSPLDVLRSATPEEMDVQRRLFGGMAAANITPRQADWYRHQDALRAAGERRRWSMRAPAGWVRPDDPPHTP